LIRITGIKPILSILVILLVASVAWNLRWHAVTTLNVDYDEDDYLRAAQQYAALIRSGDWAGLMNTNYRPEHPPLAKIVFGLSILSNPETAIIPDRPTSADPDPTLPKDQLQNARTTGAVFGTLTVILLAIINPLAGFFLAVHAFTIKYVSQVMLEALPAFTSMVTVLLYLMWKKNGRKLLDPWLIGSALFLGLTAASKYLYCVVGIAIVVDWWLVAREQEDLRPFFRSVFIWGVLALLFFGVADPYLWPDPFGRLRDSLLYHAAYASGASEVQNAGFPIWQPLVWLNTSPYAWQPDAFPVAVDPLITLFAAFGIAVLWKKQRVFALWLGIALVFLFIWPTKWPQYIVILTAPLSLAAAGGVSSLVVQPFQNWLSARRSRAGQKGVIQRNELRQALPWLAPGLMAFTVLTILPLLFQFAVSLTDFNSASIRDGFQGGIWREVSGGLTGQIAASAGRISFRSNTVHFTGLNSYLPALNYITGQRILVFNILWTFLSVGFQTLLGIGAALLLWQRGIHFKRGWEVLFILPWAIPEMVGALMWFNVFAREKGWLALAVQTYGDQTPFSVLLGWTQNPNLTMVVLLIAATWYGFPFMMLAATAGLKMLPTEVYDAAAMDGANGFGTFRYVTWPLMAPLIFPAIIIRGIFAFNQFYLFQAFGVRNGTLATLSYNFFNPSGYSINGQFSISAVLNILTMLILIGFVIWFNRFSKAGEGVTYA
jgi:ABC-type sugar transport system permease subunit